MVKNDPDRKARFFQPALGEEDRIDAVALDALAGLFGRGLGLGDEASLLFGEAGFGYQRRLLRAFFPKNLIVIINIIKQSAALDRASSAPTSA